MDVPRPECVPVVPRPDQIRSVPVRWFVITPQRLPEGEDWVFIAITPKGYENLSKNQADLLRWVEEAVWRFEYYEGANNGNE